MRTAISKTVWLLVAFLVLAPAAVAQGGWTTDEMMKLKTVGGVQVSPDGKRVVYTVNAPVMTADKSEYLTHVWMAKADGSDAHQFTFGEKSCSNAQWSPDGKWIAFTSSRSGKNNIWVIRVDGGEAEQISDVKTGVGTYQWSPDGKWFAFTMTEPKSEQEEKDDKGRNDAIVVDHNVKKAKLWVIPVAKDDKGKREARQLTKADYHVGSGLGGATLDWSPDGKAIAFVHTASPIANDWPTADISLVDVASGDVKPLAATRAAEGQPRYSPDGKWIAFVASDDPPTWGFTSWVHVVAANGGSPRKLGATHDEQPGIEGWSADGKWIYYTETRGTVTRLAAMPVQGGASKDIDAGGWVFNVNLNRSGTAFGISAQQWNRAPEAYVTRTDSWAPVQVSWANADLPKVTGNTEVVRWKSKDGMEIEGLLTYPANYEKGKRYPMVLVIHGGPAGVFVQSFLGNRSPYPTAVYAEKGWAVLRANCRGSSGYGKKFRYANYKDWGGMDYQDLMAGVDHVVQLGVADPQRLGVMGWSYGGYMTSWVITQTKRFKAASIGAPVTNLMSFTGTADIPGFIPDYFGAEFWENPDAYQKHSAMFNIKGASTPSLIQHGERDERVPIGQGYELYTALKRQGTPVKMVTYPRQPHGIQEPRLLLDAAKRNVEWFAEHLK
jgi:dipeptidyl aminopeptidase/acylaminoacyl peptidase